MISPLFCFWCDSIIFALVLKPAGRQITPSLFSSQCILGVEGMAAHERYINSNSFNPFRPIILLKGWFIQNHKYTRFPLITLQI